MNRTLRRPMFRIGGSAEGITSGLAPRQGYERGRVVNPGGYQGDPVDVALGHMQDPRIQEFIKGRRKPPGLSQFLIDFGLDIASRPPSGSIFSTAAAAAQDPFKRFQESKRLQEAYGHREATEDRDLIASLIKGMDEDKLSAMMKKVKAGVAAGYYKNEQEGIIRQLQKEEHGVMPMPGEEKNKRIRELELMISRDQEVPAGMVKAVAQHIYKIETNAYPEEVQKDLKN